jgi:hypothetical protein
MEEKPVYFTRHAAKRMIERNVKEDEVIHAIRNGEWQSAEEDRFSASEVFPFNDYHYGRYYKFKEVIPVFKVAAESILVITVYSFFFQRG